MESILYGRELLFTELPDQLREEIQAGRLLCQSRRAYTEKRGKIFCRRCGREMLATKKEECICQKECGYCRNCLKMGKVRKCSLLYSLAEENHFEERRGTLLEWKGELSLQQKEASEEIMKVSERKKKHLLWAVAGAGKTEILFPAIEKALKKGERICIASPRVDVCLELAPRIKEAFPKISIALLYGGMEEAYAYQQLTIATTHQLFRFKEAFDLLIIDEIDAFPFENDESLQRAAEKARKEESTCIYLSATPNRAMQREIKKGRLSASILPARYHGHPLPLAKTKWCVQWKNKVLNTFEKTTCGKIINQKIKNNRRFLIFLPNIHWMEQLEELLHKKYPTIQFESVSSKDPKRKEKVLKMREEKLQFLMTTTILERGVTFPNIDVLVIGAEEKVYTEAALVQIAGRCGRSAAYPRGEVLFFHDGKSLAMKRAIKQIKKMNTLARRRGLIQ